MRLADLSHINRVARCDTSPLFFRRVQEVRVGDECEIAMLVPTIDALIREIVNILGGQGIDISRFALLTGSPSNFPVLAVPT